MSHVVILGTDFQSEFPHLGKKVTPGIPKQVKVWSSKFEREVGDKITYEGQKWVVLSTGFENEDVAYSCMRGMTSLYVQKGYWNGRTSSVSQF